MTGFPNQGDGNSYWMVKPAHGAKCKQGETLTSGSVIRLQHVNTKKWLHSHEHQSPVSGNQEVSCFGGEEESNEGDNWKLELTGGDTEWRKDKKVRLIHSVTRVYLHSHNHKFGRPIAGQHEVCGSRSRDNNNYWFAAEGVYMPTPGADEL